MSLKPFAETIALTKKQCLELATNVLFLLSDAITVKYCLCQWQIIALRAALFYFISRPPLPILLHFLPGIISTTRGKILILAIMEDKSSVNFLKSRFSPWNVKKVLFCFASSFVYLRSNFLLPKLLHPLCILKVIVDRLIISGFERKKLQRSVVSYCLCETSSKCWLLQLCRCLFAPQIWRHWKYFPW